MKKLLLLICLSMLNCPGFAASLTGAGSTAVYPVLSAWASAYERISGLKIDYQAVGSGVGVTQIKSGIIDFAATDETLSKAELNTAHLQQFPLISSGIVMSQHIENLSSPLVLTRNVISKIYLAKIRYWDDLAIKQLNPGLNLPHQKITVIYRSDRSATTANFTHYLSINNPEFARQVGTDNAVSWPTGIGAKGNSGVAHYLQNIPGSIAYLEYAYTKQNNLPADYFKNARGKIIEPNAASFAASAEPVKRPSRNNRHHQSANTLDAGSPSWPMMMTTFILLPDKKSSHQDNVKNSEAFFTYCFTQGQKIAQQLAYVPLPEKTYNQIIKKFSLH